MAVSAPPLRLDHPAIAKRGTPPEIFAEVDRFYRTYIERRLAELDVPVVLPPPDVYDDGRYVAARFQSDRENDHHANADYGVLMLPRVLAAARALAPA